MNLKRTHHCEIVAGNRFKNSLSKKKKTGTTSLFSQQQQKQTTKSTEKSQAFDEIVLLACSALEIR